MLRKQGIKYWDIIKEMERVIGKRWWISFVHKIVNREFYGV